MYRVTTTHTGWCKLASGTFPFYYSPLAVVHMRE